MTEQPPVDPKLRIKVLLASAPLPTHRRNVYGTFKAFFRRRAAGENKEGAKKWIASWKIR